jgi:glutaconyl-CoA/methylmalonyl-CoA decarboxylase subunit gamma
MKKAGVSTQRSGDFRMKYNINIGNKTFEVLIDDINKRPIVAHVNGQEFLVNPEPTPLENAAQSQLAMPIGIELPGNGTITDGKLVAPLPGTVIEVFVRQGETVETGQVILIIEAMKMKNSIRSTKDGTVAAVLVSAGETVAHKQTLVEFKE